MSVTIYVTATLVQQKQQQKHQFLQDMKSWGNTYTIKPKEKKEPQLQKYHSFHEEWDNLVPQDTKMTKFIFFLLAVSFLLDSLFFTMWHDIESSRTN